VIRRSARTALARGLLIAAIATLIPAVAGCEAGQNAPTLDFHQASNGAYGSAGDITINNAYVLAAPVGSQLPAGSSAGLFVAFYNNGTATDTLLGASAPGTAASVKVTGGTVALPPSTSVNLTGPQPAIVLTGLIRPISGGQTIPVVLNFQRAGVVTLMLPVEPQSYQYTTLAQPATATPTPSAAKSPSRKPTHSAKASPSASPSKSRP